MSKVILLCGTICSGKSHYVKTLQQKQKAVLLSVDEITLTLFDGNMGDKHDEITARTKNYLLQKSLELLALGMDVILDWGFWTKQDRDNIKSYYHTRNISTELHYIQISDATWQKNIQERNKAVATRKTSAFYVDQGLAKKVTSLFEPPTPNEIDHTIHNDR